MNTAIVLDNPKLEQDIPIDSIHPDPVQPRTHPDTDLSESIKTQGILQAIAIEPIQGDEVPDVACEHCDTLFVELAALGDQFMIVDGERRWGGAVAAGSKTVLAKVVPRATEGPRLLRQLTSNAHKPLSPIEEASAFQRLMDAMGWSQAELARQLGRPRSVVGDRIRLVELDAVWLQMIQAGKLQISHSPSLHRYIAVPAKYQAEAAKNLREEIGDNAMEVDDDYLIDSVFRDFLCPVLDVPGYNGPVVGRYLDNPNSDKYAADPDLWKPMLAAKAKRAKQEGKPATAVNSQRAPQKKSALDLIPDLPRRKAGSYLHDYKLADGEVQLWAENGGWDTTFRGIPSVFLANVDRTKLQRLDFSYSGAMLITTDGAAVETARAAFAAELKAIVDAEVAELVAHISKHMSRFAVKGPGTRTILEGVSRFGSPLPMLARATGVKVEGLADEQTTVKPGGLRISDADADYLATAYVATLGGAVKVTTIVDLARPLLRKYMNAPIKFPASKNAEKRDARAAGKQVGDPKRAKKEKEVPIAAAVDVGAMRAAVEAGVDKEQLEEANA